MRRRLEDEVREALMRYAFVPVAIVALLCVAWGMFNWQWSVVRRNGEMRDLTAQIFSETVADYIDRVNEITRLSIMDACGSDEERRAFFTDFYAIVNRRADHPYFYLLDADGQTIFTNYMAAPPYFRTPWGILRRMRTADAPVVEFVRAGEKEWHLVIGRAFWENGHVTGYAALILPRAEFMSPELPPDTHWAIVDAYGYAPFSTLPQLRSENFDKISAELRAADGIVDVKDSLFYATHRDILGGAFRVYAFTPIAHILRQYAVGALILLGVLMVMTPAILMRVRRETKGQTEAVEKIMKAFHEVRRGRLNHRLDIRTGNEFEEIANSYNRTVDSIKELLRLNEEQTRAKVVSELRQLESQFNPHFLFNTLENIKYMIRLDPHAAVDMVMDLSSLLRYSIARVTNVPLAEDLEHLAGYMRIQRRRFGAQLSYEEEIAPETLPCRVPKLIMQPVVENAIKYGADDNGVIRIRVHTEKAGDLLVITVEDKGPGIAPEKLARLQEMLKSGENTSMHTGVHNVHRRIQLLYGDQYGLRITCGAEGGTCVEMRCPARSQ